MMMNNDSSNNRNRDSSVGIATGYGLDSWGSIPSKGKRFFSILQRPDRLWNPPSFLSNGRLRLLFLAGDVVPWT
jgi:hypothetical protein